MRSLRDIRRRIKSIRGTAQITHAMQMVAASKMRKAQRATLVPRPFTRLLYHVARHAITHAPDFTHLLLEVREVRNRGVVLIGTDRGLCGSLNTDLFRLAAQFDPRTTLYITVGKRASQFIARSGRRLAAEFSITDSPHFDDARPIAKFARDLFLKGEVDQVLVVNTLFISTLKQMPAALEFLPIGEIKAFNALKIFGMDLEAEQADDTTEILFEPNARTVLEYVFGHALNIFIFRALQEAKASEQSARMVAMANATDNANALIRNLTLEYNNLRQGNITQEILEIAGGQQNVG